MVRRPLPSFLEPARGGHARRYDHAARLPPGSSSHTRPRLPSHLGWPGTCSPPYAPQQANRDAGLLTAAGLLLLWGQGWVEPVVPPPEPRHIVAQQLLALCLQEHHVGNNLWADWWDGLTMFGPAARPIADHLVRRLPGIGRRDAVHRAQGRAAVRLPALHGTDHRVHHHAAVHGAVRPRGDPPDRPVLLLAGQSWRVTWTDWKRRRCFVEPADGGGRARWISPSYGGASFALSMRHLDAQLGDLNHDTLDRRRHILGRDHPDTLASAANLATDLRALGEADDGP